MKRILSIMVFWGLILCGVSCKDEGIKNVVEKEFYPSGKLGVEISYKDGKREGFSRMYYESGQLKEEGFYKNDKMEGFYRKYYESGKIAQEVMYKNDLKEGEEKKYRPTGDVEYIDTYKDGKRIARKEYDEKGNLFEGAMQRYENDAVAMAALVSMSNAFELFVIDVGKYPQSIEDLTKGDKPYLKKDLCGEGSPGFKYVCDFSDEGYEFVAIPLEMGNTGSDILVINTGQIFTEIE